MTSYKADYLNEKEEYDKAITSLKLLDEPLLKEGLFERIESYLSDKEMDYDDIFSKEKKEMTSLEVYGVDNKYHDCVYYFNYLGDDKYLSFGGSKEIHEKVVLSHSEVAAKIISLNSMTWRCIRI